jgi:hypothetical protein
MIALGWHLMLWSLVFESVTLAEVHALARALEVDGQPGLSPYEVASIEVGQREFQSADLDLDGRLTRDEFVVAYHRVLRREERPAARDLEAASLRLQALSRVRRARARVGSQPAAVARYELHTALRVQRIRQLGRAATDPVWQAAEGRIRRLEGRRRGLAGPAVARLSAGPYGSTQPPAGATRRPLPLPPGRAGPAARRRASLEPDSR